VTTEIARFDAAISVARDADAAWAALRALADATVGHKLFTVMTVDIEAGLARRVYSDHPEQYPVAGAKPISRDRWFEILHGEKRCFVGNTIGDIADVFPDAELIGSLGCGSVLNLPVVLAGELAATINLLHAEHHYTQPRVAEAQAVLAVPAKLCYLLAARLADRAKGSG
jgi:hypothetical protein